MRSNNAPAPFSPGQPAAPVRIIALLGFALAIYFPGLKSPFQYDDFSSIVDNPYVKIESLSVPGLVQAAFQGRQNRPLTNLSFALNYYLNGLDPFGYHLVNFIALAMTAIGVWLLVGKLLIRLGFDPSRAQLAGWLAAFVWSAHPAQVMAVTYIVQRHASFAGAFTIWCVYFFHRSMERPRLRNAWLAASGLSCLLALLSKETSLTLPALVFLYKVFFFDRLQKGRLKKNWKWLFALLLFYGLAAALVLRPSMLGQTLSEISETPLTPAQRIMTQPRALLWYPFFILAPFPQFLTLLHNFEPSHSLIRPATTIISLLILATVVFLAIYKAKARPAFAFAVAWYFGSLLVEAMPLPIAIANEQRLYLASLAIIVPAAGWPVLRLSNTKAVVALALLIVLFFGFFTWSRNQVWRSETALWQDTVEKSPGFLWAWFHYCNALAKSGDCRNAALACRLAAKAAPQSHKPRLNLGVCHLRRGFAEQAGAELLGAVTLNGALRDDPKWTAACSELVRLMADQNRCADALGFVETSGMDAKRISGVIEQCRSK